MAGLLVLGGAAAVADAYYQSYRVYEEVQGVIPKLATARTYLARGDVPPARPFHEIAQVAGDAQDMVEEARFTFRLTGSLPFVRAPVDAVRLGVGALQESAAAADLTRQLVQETLGEAAGARFSRRAEAPIFSDGEADIELIRSLPPRLEALVGHLEAADRKIRAIPHVPLLRRLDELRATAVAESQDAIDLAEGALKGARLLPSFLGADEPRTYFFAMQNNSDQRATGGDLLAYAFIRADDGKLELLQGGSLLEIDQKRGFPGAEIPPEVSWYMENIHGIGNPRLRHANFTPDFPLVAQAWSSQLAHSRNGMAVDGIVSVDPVVVARLLGPQRIEVPSYPDPITGRNAIDAIGYRQYLLPKEQQRAFPGELIRAAWEVMSDPPNLPLTAQRLGLGLRESRLRIWSEHRPEQALVTELDWDGAVDVGAGDYLYVTDNKLRASKLDYFTHMAIDHDVKIRADGSVESTVEVTMDNRTPPDQPLAVAGPKDYAVNEALIGAYVPVGGKFVSGEPKKGPPVHTEGQARVFLRKVEARPEDPGVARFTYTVPGVVERTASGRVYRLRIQHQPLANVAHLTVTVTLPDGSVVRSAPGWSVDGSTAIYEVNLNRDLDLEIRF